jgi:DNA-binding IclR family transcriptional regulator
MAVSSAEKVLKVLKAFSSNEYELGNRELSEKLGLPKSTISRLLHILESSDFLQKNPTNKKYQLGRAAADIGTAVNQRLSASIVNMGQTYIDLLRDSMGETAGFEVMYGNSIFLVYEAKGPNPVSVSFGVGDRLPIHVAAGAKAILAYCPPEKVEKLVMRKLPRFTKNTITNPNVLLNQLEEIRKQGVAFDKGEYDIDVYAIAGPVFSHERKPIAAAVVAAPRFRMNQQFEAKAISLIKETAEKISSRLLCPEN